MGVNAYNQRNLYCFKFKYFNFKGFWLIILFTYISLIYFFTCLYEDFLFLFFYAGFLFLAGNKIAANTGGGFSHAGKAIARGALWAGFLDILENSGMLLTLSNQGSNTIALCTTIISVIKWALAIMAVLYMLTGLLALAFRKR